MPKWRTSHGPPSVRANRYLPCRRLDSSDVPTSFRRSVVVDRPVSISVLTCSTASMRRCREVATRWRRYASTSGSSGIASARARPAFAPLLTPHGVAATRRYAGGNRLAGVHVAAAPMRSRTRKGPRRDVLERPRRRRTSGLPGGVVHAECHDEPGSGSDDADDDDCSGFVDSIGRDADEQAAGGIAEVAPEAVDADGRGSPGGVSAVADGGEKCRVDERGADAHRQRGSDPAEVLMGCDQADDAGGLQPEPGDDERFAAGAVGPGAGGELGETPGRRVNGSDDADPTDRESFVCEKDRDESPHHGVVEVVDEAGLADR